MNIIQLQKYLEIEQELNELKTRKFKKETRVLYKKKCLKFIKILIENNIEISAFRNINNNNLKQYAVIRMEQGKSINYIIQELRGVVLYHNVSHNGYAANRYIKLMDLRVLKNYLEVIEYEKNR